MGSQCTAKYAFVFILLEFDVDRLRSASVIHPRKTGLLTHIVKYLHTLYHIGRQVLGRQLWIISEELLSIHIDLLHRFALRSHRSIFVNLHAGDFLQQIFHGCIGASFERIGFKLHRISFDLYRRIGVDHHAR